MPLSAGQQCESGVIRGFSGPEAIPIVATAAVHEVCEALATHHGMSLEVRDCTSSFANESGHRSTEAGTIVRVLDGHGYINAGPFLQIRHGDWVYIPAGIEFHIVGSGATPGRRLETAIAVMAAT